MPNTSDGRGPRKFAKFHAASSDSTKRQPKIIAMLPFLSCSSVRPVSRCQALPNSTGEYHRPPNRKQATAATTTASQLTSGMVTPWLLLCGGFCARRGAASWKNGKWEKGAMIPQSSSCPFKAARRCRESGPVAARELDGREAREAAELVDEMRLVVDSRIVPQARPRAPRRRARSSRSSAPRKRCMRASAFGREPDLLLEQVAEMLAREAGLRREIFDGDAAAAGRDAIHGPAHGGVNDGARLRGARAASVRRR